MTMRESVPPRRRRWPWLLGLVTLLLVAGGLAAVLLVGRGSSGGTAHGVNYTSAQAIARALDTGGFGCTGWSPNKDVIGAREDGSCQHGTDETITVTTFTSEDQKRAIMSAFGSLASGWMVGGDRWLIGGMSNRAEADQVVRVVGGEVQGGG